MDFFSILQKNSNENENALKIKSIESVKDTEETRTKKQKMEIDNVLDQINHTNSYKNIKRGSYVKIIGVKNSILNIYKGYTGEIRDYKKDQDYAIIFLCNFNSPKVFAKNT